jgi:hypothetical protein
MRLFVGDMCQTTGQTFPDRSKCLMLKRNVANLAGKRTVKMAFPQFAELWKLIDLLVRKDFRQANLGKMKNLAEFEDELRKIQS